MRPDRLLLLIVCLTVCTAQTGCYYLRVERDKKLACLRRSPISVRKMSTAPACVPSYKEPAGFSQTYKDYLYENDPYRQSWEPGLVAVGMNQAMRVEANSTTESNNPKHEASEEPVPEPFDVHESDID